MRGTHRAQTSRVSRARRQRGSRRSARPSDFLLEWAGPLMSPPSLPLDPPMGAFDARTRMECPGRHTVVHAGAGQPETPKTDRTLSTRSLTSTRVRTEAVSCSPRGWLARHPALVRAGSARWWKHAILVGLTHRVVSGRAGGKNCAFSGQCEVKSQRQRRGSRHAQRLSRRKKTPERSLSSRAGEPRSHSRGLASQRPPPDPRMRRSSLAS